MVAPPDGSVLRARSLRHTYRGTPALTGVSLGVREGEVLAIVGPRGAGKTTLLKCLSGQLRPEHGEIWFDGEPVHSLPASARDRLRRNRFGWIGSTPELVPELTALENAALPLLLCGVPHRIARNTAAEWLDRLDVGGCARRRPADLLQSQRQRVAVARALTALPEVLFADEPTAPLHLADRRQVLRALTAAVRSHRISMLLATHDAEVAAFADRRIDLVDGSIGESTAGLRRPPRRSGQAAAADAPCGVPDAPAAPEGRIPESEGGPEAANGDPEAPAAPDAHGVPGSPPDDAARAQAEPAPGTDHQPDTAAPAEPEPGTDHQPGLRTESEADPGTESGKSASIRAAAGARGAAGPDASAAAAMDGGARCSRP